MEIRILEPRIGLPEYATGGAAAVDLRACTYDGDTIHDGMSVVIPVGQTIMIGTGIALDCGSVGTNEIDDGMFDFAALVLPRSGLGCKGIKPANSPGLIDADYHGEIKVCLVNQGSDAATIRFGDRIAQLVFISVFRPVFNKVEAFSRDTERGEDGFGSTGIE